jgi:MFS family permease
MSLPARLAPLSGLAGVACLVAGLATDKAPTSHWSDARITQWYATHGNAHWLVSAYLIAAAAPFLLIFAGVLRDRLAAAGTSRIWGSVLLGAGTAFAVTTLVGAGLYAGVPAARVFTKAPAPSPDISRYLLGASYGTLVMFSAFAAALFAATVSIGSLRSRAIPRWLALAGIPASVLMLANAVLPMAVITLWFLVASITLTVRPVREPAVVSRRSAPAEQVAVAL